MSLLLSILFGGLVGFFIDSLIGEEEVRTQLQKDEALYGEIVDMQPNTMTIKEIDEDGDTMQNRKLKSDDGISDDLYEGEIIYAYE